MGYVSSSCLTYSCSHSVPTLTNLCGGYFIQCNWNPSGTLLSKHLRRWKRELSQSRMLPAKCVWWNHINCDTLLYNKAVSASKREYLNTTSWRVTPKGICNVLWRVLQSRVAAYAMSLDFILEHGPMAESARGIWLHSACRWLHKLSWIWKRDHEAIVDGHKQEDDVEYYEKVYLLAWLAIRHTLFKWIAAVEFPKALQPMGMKRRIHVTHDESTFTANDDNV